MTFFDWFAGIGGFRLGLERTGHRCVGSCEQDKFCERVYEKNFGERFTFHDINAVRAADIPDADIWCGGFPCQGLSVAGERRGFEDARSGLWWQWLSLVEQRKPQWILIENVPGFLSCSRGADFGLALASLDYCGYGVAWRVLNAQYFGVPQRRRRVFLAGHLGAPCPSEILFEPESVCGHTAKGGQAGQEVAAPLECCIAGGRQRGDGTDHIIVHENKSGSVTEADTARALRAGASHSYQMVAHTLAAGTNAQRYDYESESLVCSTLAACGAGTSRPAGNANETGFCIVQEGVRRLMPVECERLQGFPDRWTCVCGQEPCVCPDSPRYRALGNAVAVPVVEWIGKRIENGTLLP